jgi:SagB-type dehydrogenase family enzyme
MKIIGPSRQRAGMGNRETSSAWAYHDGTKHSHWSTRSNPHFLDWANQPIPFKIYKTLEGMRLPRPDGDSGVPALAAISHSPIPGEGEQISDLETLARVLYFSAGVTRRREHPGGQIYFRAAACTGALYHIDVYLVCGDLPGLEAGVYHFGPHDFSLRRLRSGDYRKVLVGATAGDDSVAGAPAIIVMADTFWRNSWKYEARAYRHSFWDSGTILANLLAVASVLKMPARVVASFVDERVNRLLGLDTQKEAALVLVALGRTHEPPPDYADDPGVLSYETEPLSKKEVDYPAINEIHGASSLGTAEEVTALREKAADLPPSEVEGKLYPLTPLPDEGLPQMSIEGAVVRRGSTRAFARVPISYTQLSTMLDRSTRGINADFLEPFGSTLNQLYLIVNCVEGLPSGSYLYHPGLRALELLAQGDFRDKAGYLGLEQEIPADASVDVFFMADLDPILQRFGNRGYRMAQLEAGLIGGRLYLAAYGQRLGASGLTFYDDDVTQFFSPRAQGKSVMFLVALGKSVKSSVK